ncbi:MAG: hypothetical protein K6E20_03750 [Acholeplasmatales bacterium]|nr:hypothetical protein [Acholeplasmatales bacterium]
MTKELKALEEIVNKFAEQMIRANKEDLTAINKTDAIEYLYRTPQVRTLEKGLKALEIIKELESEITLFAILKKCKNYDDYLTFYDFRKRIGRELKKKFNNEEFNTLKEWIECLKN